MRHGWRGFVCHRSWAIRHAEGASTNPGWAISTPTATDNGSWKQPCFSLRHCCVLVCMATTVRHGSFWTFNRIPRESVIGGCPGMHGRVSLLGVSPLSSVLSKKKVEQQSCPVTFLRRRLLELLHLGINLAEEFLELLPLSAMRPLWCNATAQKAYLVIGLKLQAVHNRVVRVLKPSHSDQCASAAGS